MDFNLKDLDKLLIVGNEPEDKKPDDGDSESIEDMLVRSSEVIKKIDRLKSKKQKNFSKSVESALNRAVFDARKFNDHALVIAKQVARRDQVQEELLIEAKRKNDLQNQILQNIEKKNAEQKQQEVKGEPKVKHGDYESAKKWFSWWRTDYEDKHKSINRGFRARTIERLQNDYHGYEDPSKLVDKLISKYFPKNKS